MDTDFSIVELGNDRSGQRALHDLLVRMEELYFLRISSRINLQDYSFKLLKNGKAFRILDGRGENVGLLAMYINDAVHKDAFISFIGVLPEYQGKNISSDLMLKAFGVAVENGMRTISLEVNYDNLRAIGFYKKHGFREERKTDDALFMKKELTEVKKVSKPLVTISCITYNHSAYIRDALESFLIQKTNFPVEILIYDDASTDGTAEIIREHEKKHPDKIFPIYQTENQYSRGIDVSLTFQFSRARGKFIAICEGDDYWIDPLKLQKQIDIFIKYPDTIICGARAKTWNESEKEFTRVTPAFNKDIACMTPKQFFYLGDWVKNCTRMIPRELFSSVPVDYMRDYRHVHYLLAKNPHGTFRCLDEVVAVYREHDGGVFSGADPIDLLVYDFESKVLLAGLFSDDRSYNMKDRAAEIARQLARTRSLNGRKRVYYVWQYFVLIYGDLSFPGIKRIFMRTLNPLLIYIGKYPMLKKFLKSLALFVKRHFFS